MPPITERPDLSERIPAYDGMLARFFNELGTPVDDVLEKEPDTYFKMRADGQVITCHRILTDAVTIDGVQVLPGVAKDHPKFAEAERQAAFVSDVLDSLDGQGIRDVLAGALQAIADGWSIGEIIWAPIEATDGIELDGKPAAGMWRISQIKHKDPRYISILKDELYNITGFAARSELQRSVNVPPEKVWYWTAETLYSQPEGVSYYRGAYKWWVLKTEIVKLYAVYLANYATGVPVVKYPANTPAEQVRGVLAALDKARAGNNLAIPDTYDIELTALARGGEDAFERAIEICNREIAKSVWVAWMTVEGNTNDRGTYGINDSNSRAGQQRINALRQRLTDSLREGPIRQLVHFNFADPILPLLTMQETEQTDIKLLLETFALASDVTRTPLKREVVVEEAGLPEDLLDVEQAEENARLAEEQFRQTQDSGAGSTDREIAEQTDTDQDTD